jgi:hypothetical protein
MDAEMKAGAMVRVTRDLGIEIRGCTWYEMKNHVELLCTCYSHEEWLIDKRVRVHLDTADISNNFEYQTSKHPAEKAPRSTSDS